MTTSQKSYLGQIEALENKLRTLDLDYNEYGTCICGGDKEIKKQIEKIEAKMYA